MSGGPHKAAGQAGAGGGLSFCIRRADAADWPALWAMLEPVFRAGETYAVARDIDETAARAMWLDTPAATYIAEDAQSTALGTFYIKANFSGGADHICNCGYITAPAAAGARCRHRDVRAVSGSSARAWV